MSDTSSREYVGAAAGTRNSGDSETPLDNEVRVQPNGPLVLTGHIEVRAGDGEPGEPGTKPGGDIALCRCGHSADKPFCDGSHNRVGFEDPGLIQGGRLVGASAGERAAATISGAPDGPLLVRGPVTVVAADGTTSTGSRGALCRCGASSTKPFCDGSHRALGFTAE